MDIDATTLDGAQIARDALSAQAGDRAARDGLFSLLRPNIARFVARYAGRARESVAWDLEDLHQESFLVFAEVLVAWPGEGEFIAYFFAVFPKRLATAVRRLDGVQPWVRHGAVDDRPDGTAQDLDTRALILDFVTRLSPTERRILALHVWESFPLPDAARHAGLPLDDTRRVWRRIRIKARAFSSDRAIPGADDR